jgi:hypothetical protein
MNKFPNVLDHYDDNGLLLRRTFDGKDIPAIIKTAADLSSVRVRHDEDYALVYQGEYGKEYRLPVADAGNAVASALYFAEYGDRLPQEHQKVAAANLKIALESFGFDVPERLTKTATIELGRTGEADNLTLEALFGLPDNSLEEVKGAFDDCSPRGKRRMMLQVKEASAKLPQHMQDYGRSELGTDLEASLDLRKLATGMDRDAVAQLKSLMEKAASMDPDLLANEIELFDLEHDLTRLYGRTIPDPYASVFGTSLTIKTASASSLEIDGRHYSADTIEAFAQNGADRVKDAFGDDFAGEFSRSPVSVLASLPVTHQQAIARMMG